MREGGEITEHEVIKWCENKAADNLYLSYFQVRTVAGNPF